MEKLIGTQSSVFKLMRTIVGQETNSGTQTKRDLVSFTVTRVVSNLGQLPQIIMWGVCFIINGSVSLNG